MKRTEIESSNIISIGYDAKTQVLEIEFIKHGKADAGQGVQSPVYQYFKVPQALYDSLMASESKGRFFHRHIRNDFETFKVLLSKLKGSLELTEADRIASKYEKKEASHG